MIGSLADPELLRPSCQILLDGLDLLFILPAVVGKGPDLSGNTLQLFQISVLLFLLGSGFFLCLRRPAGKLFPAHLDLFQHSVVLLDLGLGRSPVIEKLHDIAFILVNRSRQGSDPGLDCDQFFSGLVLQGLLLLQFPFDLFLFLLASGQLALPVQKLCLDGLGPLVVMLVVHMGAVDLFPQKSDLILQLLFQHGGLIELALGLLDGRLNAVYLLLYRLVLLLHIRIGAACLCKLLAGSGKLSFDPLDLLPDPGRLQKEHIDIVSL